MARFVGQDEFWSAQIMQVDIDPERGAVLRNVLPAVAGCRRAQALIGLRVRRAFDPRGSARVRGALQPRVGRAWRRDELALSPSRVRGGSIRR